MPTKYAMTWFAPRSCWKKKYKGKVYYCPTQCAGKTTDRSGYSASLAWWENKRKELVDDSVSVSPHFPPLTNDDRKEVAAMVGATDGPSTEHATLRVLRQKQRATDPLFGTSEAAKWIAMDRERATPRVPKERTVEGLTDRFIQAQAQGAISGMKSAGRVQTIRTYIHQFRNFVGLDTAITDVTAMTLHDYHAKTLADIHSKQLSSLGGRDRMQVAKQFIRWAWELNLVDLPRNIDSKNLVIYLDQREIKVFEIAKLKKIIDGAPEPLKAYLLLMANCGMTAMDVAELRHDEVHKKAGTITRVRSKRGKKKSADIEGGRNKIKVTWKLWPLTLQLLKQNRNPTGIYVFKQPGGELLVYNRINPTTLKGSDIDLIARSYERYCAASEISKADAKSLKCIRATSSTTLGAHPEFARYALHFLGQSMKTVADTFYVKPSQEQFDRAVHWLGEQLLN